MRERPIIFSGEMVRAILDGRKSQTRRILNPQPDDYLDTWKPVRPVTEFYCVGTDVKTGRGEYLARDKDHQPVCAFMAGGDSVTPRIFCNDGVAGDRLWVRETFFIDHYEYYPDGRLPKERPDCVLDEQILFRADGTCCDQLGECQCEGEGAVWRPSIHMPRWASRITLEITKVRVERLQDISDDDIIAEGRSLPIDKKCCDVSAYLHAVFKERWDSLHGKGAWDKNPWVWVLEFKKV
jgi:hypothetical protein